MNQITLTRPDDWHCHFRDDFFLQETVPATARCFARAVAMPNLAPPIVNAEQALAYRQRLLEHAPTSSQFEPLVTLYLTNQTTKQTIFDAHKAGILASKLYPAGATTNSADGVNSIESLYPVFQAMSECNMLLLIHGETTDSTSDIFDREKLFIDQTLSQLCERFPSLKIVFEHVTTKDAVDFVLSLPSTQLAATITPQHLMYNRNDLLAGGIRPHNYCLPILKRSNHQQRLQQAVASGSTQFFLGTDSAPHPLHAKQSSCGCAGCYSAWSAIELYTQVFEDLEALDKLEGFASHHGADFYGLPRNTDTITLVREQWTVPERLQLKDGSDIVPFYAGQSINWKLRI